MVLWQEIGDALWLPSEEYEKLDAERAMKKAKTVLMISSQFTDEWFSEKDIGKWLYEIWIAGTIGEKKFC